MYCMKKSGLALLSLITFSIAIKADDKIESAQDLFFATSTIRQLMDKSHESLIEGALESQGLKCDRSAIAYVQCDSANKFNQSSLRVDLHHIYNMKSERLIARVILNQEFKDCPKAGNIKERLSQGLRMLPPATSLSPPKNPDQAIMAQTLKEEEKRWSYISSENAKASHYTVSATVRYLPDKPACAINVLIQSF